MSIQGNSHARRVVWLPGVLLLLALACNLPATSAPPPSTPTQPAGEDLAWPGDVDNPVRLEVVNGLSGDICALYISPPIDATWGGNWLPGGERIPPGGSRVFDVPAGRYDLMAEDCEGGMLGEERDFDLLAAHTYTFSGAVGGTVPPPEGVEGAVVGIYRDCAQPAITAKDDILLHVGWIASSIELAESNADHMYFVTRVDGVELGGVEPIRQPARTIMPLDEFGCGFDELAPAVYWYLPIGRLEAGTHTVEVEYFTDAHIDDGYDTYEAGSMGSIEKTIQVSGEGRVALILVNDSASEICSVWIGWPESEWAADLLEEQGITLDSRESSAVLIVPDTWALRADDCAGDTVAFEPAYDITSDTLWRIGSGTGAGGGATGGTCGDGRCQPGESYDACPDDCNPPQGVLPPGATCGDGSCEADEAFEGGDFCPYDCGWCGDGICTDPEWMLVRPCSQDCD